MYETAKNGRDIVAALLFFSTSTLITWWFIVAGSGLYTSQEKMLISCSIAGAKWGLQILAALVLLGDRKWVFIRRIGFVCLVGSAILLPFCFKAVQIRLGQQGFLYSLVICVLVMIVLYYRSVRTTGLSMRWFWGWIICLAAAISLQLSVVFNLLCGCA